MSLILLKMSLTCLKDKIMEGNSDTVQPQDRKRERFDGFVRVIIPWPVLR